MSSNLFDDPLFRDDRGRGRYPDPGVEGVVDAPQHVWRIVTGDDPGPPEPPPDEPGQGEDDHFDPGGDNPAGWHGSLGGAFIFDRPAGIPALWGSGDQVAWAKDESLICAHPGVGKTTLAGLLVRAQLRISDESAVLGLEVPEADCDTILYLAMDRPAQIARSMARQFHPDWRDVIDKRLIVRDGPPPADIAKNPHLLTKMADYYQAGIVYADSVKDAAVGLSDDEVSAGYNRARQHLLHSGRQLIELHHPRKSWDGHTTPTLNDVYGGMWITAGAGSVFMLGGVAGDPISRMYHLKQAAAELPPIDIEVNHDDGEMTVADRADVLELVKNTGSHGLTAFALAAHLYGPKPTEAQIKKAQRILERKTKAGQLISRPGQRGGTHEGTKGSQPTVWFPAA